MPSIKNSVRRHSLGTQAACGVAAIRMDRARKPWSVDRWGRLIAGASVLVCTVLGLLHHQLWLVGSLMCASNLVFTSFTDRCAVRALLRRLGAREREDLFLPGGAPRTSED